MMEEEFSQSDFKLLYFLYTRGGQYIGSKRQLGKELKSGNRIYDRVRKLVDGGYLKEQNYIQLTPKGRACLEPFDFARAILRAFLPAVGLTQVLLGVMYLLGVFRMFSPLSLVLGGIVIIFGSIVFWWKERKAEHKFFLEHTQSV